MDVLVSLTNNVGPYTETLKFRAQNWEGIAENQVIASSVTRVT